MNRIVLTDYNGQLSSSLWEKDRPAELALYEQEPEYRLGDIYLARVQDIVPGIRAAFVWLTPRQKAYLPLEQAPSRLRCGDELPVQIVKEAQKTKDPVATGHISLAGRLTVLVTDSCRVCVSAKISDTAWKERIGHLLEPLLTVPQAEGTAASSYGFIIRTGALQASDDEIYQEAKALAGRYRRLCREAATHVCYTRLWQSEPPWLTRLYKLTGVQTEIVTDLPEVYEACQTFLK